MITIEESMYAGFGIVMFMTVFLIMSSLAQTVTPKAQLLAADDIIKVVKTAMVKVYSEGRFYQGTAAIAYINLPDVIGGSKYHITCVNNSICVTFPVNRCDEMYLLNQNLVLNCSIDSSEDVHYVKYTNGTVEAR